MLMYLTMMNLSLLLLIQTDKFHKFVFGIKLISNEEHPKIRIDQETLFYKFLLLGICNVDIIIDLVYSILISAVVNFPDDAVVSSTNNKTFHLINHVFRLTFISNK